MKNIVNYRVFIIVLLIMAYACKKENQKYSCDENINEWVIQNKSTIDTLTRGYFITLPIDYQVAAFNYLSHSQKVELWQSKLALLLNQSYYNELAKSSIRDLQELVCVDLYNGTVSISDGDIWSIMDMSGLDSLTMIIDFSTLFTYDELEYYVDNYEQIHNDWFGENYELRKPEPRPKCMCRWNITCGLFNHGLCEEGYDDCTPGWGCGWFFAEPCDGRCDSNPFQYNPQ